MTASDATEGPECGVHGGVVTFPALSGPLPPTLPHLPGKMAAPGDGDAPGAGDGAQGGAHGVVTLPTPCLEQIAVIHPAIVHLPGEEEMWSISVDKVKKGVHPPAVVRMPRSDDKDVWGQDPADQTNNTIIFVPPCAACPSGAGRWPC